MLNIKKHWKTLIQIICGIAFLIGTLYYFGFQNYVIGFEHINYPLLSLTILTDLAIQIAISYKLYYLLKKDAPTQFKDCMYVSMWGTLIGSIIKGGGIVYMIEALHKTSNLPRETVANKVSFMYAVGLIVNVVGCIFGLYIIGDVLPHTYLLFIQIAIVVVAVFSGLFLLISFSNRAQQLKTKLLSRNKVGRIISGYLGTKTYSFKKDALVILVLTIGAWIAEAISWIIQSYAIGFPIPFFFAFGVFYIVGMIKAIPLASIGIYDLLMAVGYTIIGGTAIIGLIFAMVDRLSWTLVNAIAVTKPKYISVIFRRKSGT